MGKVKVIVVNGLSRSGKNSFVNAVKKKAPVVVEHSTIATVKNCLHYFNMIDGRKKGFKERIFLATVKQAWIDYNDGPLKELVDIVSDLERTYMLTLNVDRVLLFVHVREPSEIYKLYNKFIIDFFSVLVHRPDTKSQPGDEHVLNFDYDFDIYNKGTLEDLDKEADRFIQYLNEEAK